MTPGRLLAARLLATVPGIIGAGGLLLGMNAYLGVLLCLACVVLIATVERAANA